MRRTQLYLDDHLCNALHVRARMEGSTVSALVREAVRERYLGNREEQAKAMQALVGIRKQRPETANTAEYVRSLRHGARLGRLSKR